MCPPQSPPAAAAQKLTPNSQRVLLETSFGSPTPPMNGKALQNGLRAKKSEIQRRGHSGKPLKTVAFSSNNGTLYPPPRYKPTTLSLCETRPNPFEGQVVDLIHDDWFGLAPLASPESLSEISSISSRASLSLNLNLSNSIERFLNRVTSNIKTPTPPPNLPSPDIFESQLKTPPLVMRRTPKYKENLATCATEWKNQNSYKRLGKVFLTQPMMMGSDSDEDGGNNYGTAESLPKGVCCNNDKNNNSSGKDDAKDWKSADNIDNETSHNRFDNRKFTVSDSAMMNDCISECPVCPCTKLPPEDCCLKSDHIACIMMSAQEYRASEKYSITNTTSSSDTYYSLPDSECGFLQNGARIMLSKLGTYEEETLMCELPSTQDSITLNPTAISSMTRSGILESHFPVYFDSSDEKSSLLSNENSPSQRNNAQRKGARSAVGGGGGGGRKKSNDDFCRFSRNESLPLLSNLVEKSSPTNYMKRKKMIYPICHTPPIIHQSPKIFPVKSHSRSTPVSMSNLYVFNESNV